MAWEKNGTPDTLGLSGDLMEISDLTPLKFNQFLCHAIADAQTEPLITYDNDTTANYALRYNTNGGTDTEQPNSTNMFTHTPSNLSDNFHFEYTINLTNDEKLVLYWSIGANTTGAANPPTRREFAGKWVNTATQISEIDITNGGTGSFDTNSNLSALGTD